MSYVMSDAVKLYFDVSPKSSWLHIWVISSLRTVSPGFGVEVDGIVSGHAFWLEISAIHESLIVGDDCDPAI
jgi:hypothetical protein